MSDNLVGSWFSQNETRNWEGVNKPEFLSDT